MTVLHMTPRKVVVVGAGMAGLVCARRLQRAGHSVSLVEKSRGVGGRMATRRIDGTPLDHGARYITPQGETLRFLTEQWLQRGILQPWRPHCFSLTQEGLKAVHQDTVYYTAPAGMSAVGKELAQSLTIHRQQRAIALTFDENGWLLTAERTDDGILVRHTADALVLAIPAPQVEPLLADLASTPEVDKLKGAIAHVRYAPCLTVLAQYSHPLVSTPSPLPCAPNEPWMVDGGTDSPFFWLGLDSSKRPTPNINVVFHSSAPFARRWLETPDLQTPGFSLLEEAGQWVAPWLAKPQRWQVHRWRYAYIEAPHPEPICPVADPLPLVACGDWCGDRQIDTALDAGWQAAQQIHALFTGATLPAFPVGLE